MTLHVVQEECLYKVIKFIHRHNGNARNLTIYGQEKNPTTWKLAKMNLAIRGINNDGLGKFCR